MKTNTKIGLFIAGLAAWMIARRNKSVAGIGAAKRRIFKELSLAQKAGVDFTKKYDELSASEIKALQKVSNETGYTENYYKSLKKAYDAISGIGATYDVVDEAGNTVLTWVEDPANSQARTAYSAADEAERERALLEAREIEDDRALYEQQKASEIDEREKRLAETRKRLKKSGRSSQMALFGVDAPEYTKMKLDTYLNTYHVSELIAEAKSADKILCEVGDERGGRSFYLGKRNFMQFFNYCLMRNIPIALWNGERWITRNGGEELLVPDPEVEAELYEIWREQIEYGETDLDYDRWRELVGDEYAKSDVLPYMR